VGGAGTRAVCPRWGDLAGVAREEGGRHADSYVPRGMTQPQLLVWEQFTVMRWDIEHTDPKNSHEDGPFPGYVAASGGWVDAQVQVRIDGLRPGDWFQIQFQLHDWTDDRPSEDPWSEIVADLPATTEGSVRYRYGLQARTGGLASVGRRGGIPGRFERGAAATQGCVPVGGPCGRTARLNRPRSSQSRISGQGSVKYPTVHGLSGKYQGDVGRVTSHNSGQLVGRSLSDSVEVANRFEGFCPMCVG